MTDKSNRVAVLTEIAFRARRSWRKTGEEYLAAAAALVEARDLCEHGEWMPWLEKTGIPERTAQRMMQLARAGIKSDTLTVLGASRIIELLTKFGDIPEDMDRDNLCMMVEYFLEPSRYLWEIAHRSADRRGDESMLDMLDAVRPSTPAVAYAWIKWGAAWPVGRETDAVKAWAAMSPWLPGNIPEAA